MRTLYAEYEAYATITDATDKRMERIKREKSVLIWWARMR